MLERMYAQYGINIIKWLPFPEPCLSSEFNVSS